MSAIGAKLLFLRTSYKNLLLAGPVLEHTIVQKSTLSHCQRLLANQYLVRFHATGPADKKDLEPEIQDTLKKFKQGSYDTLTDPQSLKHFRKEKVAVNILSSKDEPPIGTDALPHPIWSEKELHNVVITHRKPVGFIDWFAYFGVKFTRGCYDLFSGYMFGTPNEKMWLTRLCFLETVAGVPGMVAAMVRHLDSLRKMRRDHGWIHTLLEEAENERMHLMVMLHLKKPSVFFRLLVMLTQGVFVSGFSVAYMLSPKLCHRFVGYLEEEAVVTYTKLLEEIEAGNMKHWKEFPAPEVAVSYWKLLPGSVMKDVILAIRADEAHHRVVNHTLGSMKHDDYNPYKPGQ